ncbi:hydroxymethylglutaryl-CoA lyase [Hydrobacter penzbergensis]|jgi:hydroxymethylglutaryl-CoA lyase|uniref:Hydroxymethylglutaryl-CoA lyase n=1 Tax=Hydrobacter penzbergensis TaxID=1235997 RepID=A0A8X8IDZ8_9BACT|nr:hydroxymethylglutaryl-CoA lyase [Hydrobacter penzbergensis]MBN8717869.1 hydroxymethylglutaryl-CoA lyase [Sediminibacterium magnilacihabitans]PQV61459.1 hydroxymethylglutaryl-CoA lyase [Sediminibacterium magnilacihabitans]SDW47825.1 hydroxymethylglutaryl-CoA lyase [Hydrobacter penzbergensis]
MNADALLPALQLIECPRDAMQGWPHLIATADKVRYLNALLQVGFDTLDFGSFVSPKAMPQMADTKEVLKGLDLGSTSTKLLAIVANERGAEEAVVYDTVHYLGFPFSISPTFQLRNTNSTIEESEQRVDAIQELCLKTGKELVIYLSMGFGNPYNDPYNEDILLHWADAMAEKDIRIISLADTVGLANPSQISKALITLIPQYPDITIGVHLHSTAQNWEAKLTAALDAGCLRFDGALKGIGGCPMAQDDLVGNMDTLLMIGYFKERGFLKEINEQAMYNCLQIADSIFQ